MFRLFCYDGHLFESCFYFHLSHSLSFVAIFCFSIDDIQHAGVWVCALINEEAYQYARSNLKCPSSLPLLVLKWIFEEWMFTAINSILKRKVLKLYAAYSHCNSFSFLNLSILVRFAMEKWRKKNKRFLLPPTKAYLTVWSRNNRIQHSGGVSQKQHSNTSFVQH